MTLTAGVTVISRWDHKCVHGGMAPRATGWKNAIQYKMLMRPWGSIGSNTIFYCTCLPKKSEVGYIF